jgi:hypothetical protein
MQEIRHDGRVRQQQGNTIHQDTEADAGSRGRVAQEPRNGKRTKRVTADCQTVRGLAVLATTRLHQFLHSPHRLVL